MKERITWKAFLDDGTVVEPPISSDRIERDRCVRFTLYDSQTKEMIADVHFNPPDQRLVYRARKTLSPGIGITQICHLIGKHKKDCLDEVLWVVEGGAIYATSGYDPMHELFYPPEFSMDELLFPDETT